MNNRQSDRSSHRTPPRAAGLFPEGLRGRQPVEAEGGCGVTGFACTIPVGGRHIYEPSIQMRNRGNGKGGGIAACGLVPEDMGVSRKVLEEDYILQVALLDPTARAEVEKSFIEPYFDVDQGGLIPTVDDHREVPLLEVRPPDVARYFVRVKPSVLARFAEEKNLASRAGLSERDVEDEFIFQNSIRLNNQYYASLGDKRAFVVSHARNLLIVKIVGFAEAAVQYYRMEDTRAHVWIAHQRYPTKGRVWHPGGAHPFIGLNEALVHNGDFANYVSVCEYLAGRGIYPQFLTDTEVSVLLFDLWNRVYQYPVEYIIEALAPTTETDFDRLPSEKQRIYRQIQAAHIHASPDGPWFFIIARSLAETKQFQLMGITDTAMLRPQVFALQEGEVSIGLICSEKQAIDATLGQPCPRGFPLHAGGRHVLECPRRQFDRRRRVLVDGVAGREREQGAGSTGERRVGRVATAMVPIPPDEWQDGRAGNGNGPSSNWPLHHAGHEQVRRHRGHAPRTAALQSVGAGQDAGRHRGRSGSRSMTLAAGGRRAKQLFAHFRDALPSMDYDRLRWFVDELAAQTAQKNPALGIQALTLAIDRRYPTGDKKRSSVLTIVRGGLERIFQAQPLCDELCTSGFPA